MTAEQTGFDPDQSPSSEKRRPRGQKSAQPPNPALYDYIGKQLRALYEEVAEEPIPPDLLRLLAELEKKQGDG